MFLDPKGQYISTNQIKIINVCMSVISKFCLSSSSVVCSASTTYTSLCRDLKYLLKVGYILVVYLNVASFFDFRDPSFGQVENIALCLNKYHKNERHLCLVTNSFTRLSQNVCLISTHLFIYRQEMS